MTRTLTRLAGVMAAVLPCLSAWAGATYTNEPASVAWPFNTAEYSTVTSAPEGGFSMKNFDAPKFEYKGTGTATMLPGVTLLKFNSTSSSDIATWSLRPAKGLTFTPTRVHFYITRFGTDGSESSNSVQLAVTGGEKITLAQVTPGRDNRNRDGSDGVSKDKWSDKASLMWECDFTLTEAQQNALTSGAGLELSVNHGLATGKQIGFSDIKIEGLLNGTAEDVAKYALTATPNIEGAGQVSISPAAAEYEEGVEVKFLAERNFGYAFVNWTDAAGNVVSQEPSFTHTVTGAVAYTANFKAIPTYELAYTVEGGANDYQVTATPAGTMVGGKRMYEEGTTVKLTATGNPIVKFTNWGDGQSSSEISILMDADHTDIAAVFDAVDYIAGWDFIRSGNNGRPADFASADNDAAALVMRNAEGTTFGWLDKSQQGAGGYEGRPAAVNWNTSEGIGNTYWQTTVNAEAFTSLKVITAMAYNYNAYTTYDIEWSLDGETWTKAGSITINGAKDWVDGTYELPEACNNQKAVSIRIKADLTSEKRGTSSNNDGAALGGTYIIGTAALVNDGTAPVLTAQVPAEGSSTASINGKIVLTFDEKVKVKEGTTATLGTIALTPSVTGKTVMFEYKNLNYSTEYRFTLPAGSVSDLCDNTLGEAITINFATKTRPAVAKAPYDAEVSTVDELIAALAAAEAREDNTKRYRIFLHNGNYKLPASATGTKTGSDGNTYADPTTYINTPRLSLIGESRDGVVITNTLPADGSLLEGIGNGDVINLNKNAVETYMQDITLRSSMGDNKGRDIVLNDKSDKTVAMNVCLWGYQDTYVSNNSNSRFYFEGGLLRGRTDFLCGKGDVYYNAVNLHMCAAGYLAVPSVPKQYGYIFKDCEITGDAGVDGKYTLGRPWGSGTPIALFIDTKMTVKPTAEGWNEMSGGWPARFAEYNSTTASGTVIDLKDRKKKFGSADKSGIFDNNPVLTKAEADYHSYERVMGGDDDWDPASLAEQAPAPANVLINGTILTWDACDYTSLWAVCRDGKIIGFTTEPSFDVAETTPAARSGEAIYSVRAANEMGGLGEGIIATPDLGNTAIDTVGAAAPVKSTRWYNMQGVAVSPSTPGVLLRIDTMADGSTTTTKVVVK